MTEFYLMTPEHVLWKEIISFAENCSWRAGSYLAEKMKNHDFKEWERVCAVYVNGKPAGFCTFAEKDELPEKFEFTPFIGFVYVGEPYRGNRLSEQMFRIIFPYAEGLGYDRIYIMSGEIGLYEKYGFIKLGEYETVYGSTDQLFVRSL